MSKEPYGYALLFDQLLGAGLPDWECLYVVTQACAKHDDTTVTAEIERQIRWEVETCNRKPAHLAVVEITEPIGVRGRYSRKITFTDLKYRLDD